MAENSKKFMKRIAKIADLQMEALSEINKGNLARAAKLREKAEELIVEAYKENDK